MMLLLWRNDYGVDSVCVSDGKIAGRDEDVQMRLPTATESAVSPYVTILAAGAISVLKPTRCSTVSGHVPIFAATATAVNRIHRCARRGRWLLLGVHGVAPAVVDLANPDRRDSP